MAYSLFITEEDFKTFRFVGARYCWSEACRNLLNVGDNLISEVDARSLRASFEADMEGGHVPFPMLTRCELRDKLASFWDSIV